MRRSSIFAVGLGLLLLVGWGGVGEADRHEVWVANRGADKVQVLDPDSLKVKAEIAVGKKPHSVTFSGDFKRAYVANAGSGDVSVIDTASRAVVATVRAGKGARHVAVSPDGKLLYVTTPIDNAVAVIDAASQTMVKTIAVGKTPAMALFSPDGKKAYVSNAGDGTVSVVDVAQGQAVKTIAGIGRGAAGLFLSGANLYVTAEGEDKVAIIDTKKDEVAKQIPVGKAPYGVSASGFGGVVLVANRNSNDLSVIDTDALEVTGTVSGLNGPTLMAPSPKGFNLFVTNGGREPGVAVVDPFRPDVLKSVKQAGQPHGIAVKR